MAAVLPVMFLILAILVFAAHEEWRIAVLHGAIVTGLAVVINTELLSLVRALAIVQLATVWVLECAIATAGVWWRREQIRVRTAHLRALRPDRYVVFFLIPVVAIVVATAVIAAVAPPNTFDSMTYHMARVAHWASDQSVGFYPTNIVRQLYSPPWAEYAMAQLQILSGGDGAANLVQWFSMVGSVIVVSLIARQLGASFRGQLFTSIAAVTLPMGILQATSTQTDYAVGFWLLCTIAAAMIFAETRARTSAFWVGASLGLTVLSKGTAYLFLAPLVLMLGTWMLVRLRNDFVGAAALMVVVPMLINSGIWIRNELTFQNPLAPSAETAMVANDTHSPAAILSNLLRDSVLQFGTPIPQVNQRTESAIVKFHTVVLHIDVSDPRTTFGDSKFAVNPASFDEDYAGDPLQGLAALVAIIVALIGWRRRPLPGLYAAGLIVGLVLFAVYLKWQPWLSRLELPLMLASCPLIGSTLGVRLRPPGLVAIGAVLLIAAVPFVIDNQTRPMVGFGFGKRLLPTGVTIFNTPRSDLYFVKYTSIEDPYSMAAQEAREANCRDIALWARGNDWEYPLWALTAADGVRFDSVMVTNPSARASDFGAKRPCLLVTTKPDPPPSVTVDGVAFTQVWLVNDVGLYKPGNSGT